MLRLENNAHRGRQKDKRSHLKGSGLTAHCCQKAKREGNAVSSSRIDIFFSYIPLLIADETTFERARPFAAFVRYFLALHFESWKRAPTKIIPPRRRCRVLSAVRRAVMYANPVYWLGGGA